MEYQIRKEILPAYFQIGYFSLHQGLAIGKAEPLSPSPISALHYHQCFELGVCISGSGETHIENRIYRFRRGDIQYITPNIPHLSTAYAGEKCEWVWIFIDPTAIGANLEKKGFMDLPEIFSQSFNGVFSPHEHPRLYSRITDLLERPKEDSFTPIDNFLMVGQIMIEAARIGNIDKSQSKLPVSEQIKPALVYIRENYNNPQMMSAELIASSCGLSTSHFRMLFKNDIGMTLPQYINQTRLSAANHLLETTDKKIIQIAEEAGFNEVPYFNRVFRETFGMTPKEMREKRSKRR